MVVLEFTRPVLVQFVFWNTKSKKKQNSKIKKNKYNVFVNKNLLNS